MENLTTEKQPEIYHLELRLNDKQNQSYFIHYFCFTQVRWLKFMLWISVIIKQYPLLYNV